MIIMDKINKYVSLDACKSPPMSEEAENPTVERSIGSENYGSDEKNDCAVKMDYYSDHDFVNPFYCLGM